MTKTIAHFGLGVALATLMTAAGYAQEVSTTAVPVTLGGAQVELASGRWFKAADMYARLVNAQDDVSRAQARYGLAIALSQLGQEEKALRTLDGTLANDSPLGQAVAELRGRLLLQLADKALAREGYAAATPWLEQYDRLTVHPDKARYARIKGAGEVVDTSAGPSLVLRVGVLLPLSGDLQPVGDDILRGIQLGLKAFDGRRGTRLELLPVNADDAVSAKAAASDLLAQKVDVVIGPLTSTAVEAAEGILRPAGVPLLVLSSDRVVLGQGAYALNYLPAEQARAVARLAVAKGKRRAAGLIPSTPYGYEVFDAFQDEMRKRGGTIVGSAFYNPGNTDIGASIRTLVDTVSGTSNVYARGFDTLFLPAPGGTLPLVVSQLSYYDVDKVDENGDKALLLGTALWQDPRVLNASASAVRGGLFAVPKQDDAFEASFQQAFGAKPHPLALLGYDAMRVLADIAAEKQRTGDDFTHLLLRPEGFYGNGGYLLFAKDGVTERGLNIVKVGEQFEVEKAALDMAPLAVPENLMPRGGGGGGWW